jgi:hypothetical protein
VTLLAIFALLIGGMGTAAILAVFAVVVLLGQRASFPAWLLLSWAGLWFFSTPMYHPYARLVLPFTMAVYLAAGLFLSTLINHLADKTQAISWRPILALSGAAILVAVIALWLPDPSNPWQPSRDMPKAATAMKTVIPPNSRVIVIGEPSVAFYLHLAGRPAFDRLQDMDELKKLETPAYIVTGRYAKVAPPIRNGLKALGNRLVPLQTFPVNPREIRLIDDASPQKVYDFRANPDDSFDLTIYHLLPKSQAP